VSPEEIAALHPRLYHVTRPHAVAAIRKHGLLSATRLLELFEIPPKQREMLQTRRRPTNVEITHPAYGVATLTDNIPLSEGALLKCLDDGLKPADWMRLLNRRVFFWVDEKNLSNHLAANVRTGEQRIVLSFDTLSLVRACYSDVELTAINTGSTIRRPARRGLSTFSPLERYSYREWQQLRGRRDQIKELTVKDRVADMEAHLVADYVFKPPV